MRLLKKIYLAFIYASNMALSNQYLDSRFKIETEISKSARLEDLSTQQKAARRGLAREAMNMNMKKLIELA